MNKAALRIADSRRAGLVSPLAWMKSKRIAAYVGPRKLKGEARLVDIYRLDLLTCLVTRC